MAVHCCQHGSFPNCVSCTELKIWCLIRTVFVKQEKFPFVEEKLQTLKGTEELGFQAVVMPLYVQYGSLHHVVSCRK